MTVSEWDGYIDDYDPPPPPRWPIKRRPYFGDFIFNVAKGRLDELAVEDGWVQIILLKASWKWLWRRRYAVGPHPIMTTVDELFLRGRNREADFGGYERRRVPTQASTRRTAHGVQTEFELEDVSWRCSPPSNDIGWLVIASPGGTVITAHEFRVTTGDDPGVDLQAVVGRFGFAVSSL